MGLAVHVRDSCPMRVSCCTHMHAHTRNSQDPLHPLHCRLKPSLVAVEYISCVDAVSSGEFFLFFLKILLQCLFSVILDEMQIFDVIK